MPGPNLNSPDWDVELPDAPFGGRVMVLGHRCGAAELGASLFELDPGGAATPYHMHLGNEEMLIVLSGQPELRTPEGSRRLSAGEIVAFPRGAQGAHRVTNPGDEPARFLMVSTTNLPDVAEHLDTGTTLTITGAQDGKTFPAGTDVPPMESVHKAMAAAAERERDG